MKHIRTNHHSMESIPYKNVPTALISWALNSIPGKNPHIFEPSPVKIGHTL